MSKVETIILQACNEASDHIGVAFYCDDMGTVKQLPINVRASRLCGAAGKPITISGDCFFARYFDDGKDFFRRCDFTLHDTVDADWIIKTRKANERVASEAKDEKAAVKMAQAVKGSSLSTCAMGFVAGCKKPGSKLCVACKKIGYCSVCVDLFFPLRCCFVLLFVCLLCLLRARSLSHALKTHSHNVFRSRLVYLQCMPEEGLEAAQVRAGMLGLHVLCVFCVLFCFTCFCAVLTPPHNMPHAYTLLLPYTRLSCVGVAKKK
jgi:hypothetical protein